jgi:hypothetical protein
MRKILSEYDFPFLLGIDLESEWKRVLTVVEKHPWLTVDGYFQNEQQYRRYQISMGTAASEVELWRIENWNDKYYLDEIYRSRYWLSQIDCIKSFNYRHTSYGLKHACENWWGVEKSKLGIEDSVSYVANGCLIVAALILEWKFTDTYQGERSLNVHFPISEKSLKLLKPDYIG